MSMPSPEAIVGREAELQRLRDWVRAPTRPVVTFLEGDAGVGKTALLEAIAAEAAVAGASVLRARPTAAEAASSFAALDDLLRPAIDELRRLPEPQRRALAAALLLEEAADPVDPRQVGLACLSLLHALPRPVLAIDDWHWLDSASAAVLSFVLRRLEAGGARVLATIRRGEADEALARLVGALPPGQAVELVLEPLDTGALGRLVHARTGEWMSPPALTRLHEACGGNPLMALELVRAPGAQPSTDVRRLLARRVGALSADTRTALRFVSALGDPTVEAVEMAMNAPSLSAQALDEALAADVLARDDRRLRFTHPLIAAVVQDGAPPAEWRAINARLAELAGPAEQQARHLAAASIGPDEVVAAALEMAGTEAMGRGAALVGAELAERAAELTPLDDEPCRLRRLLAAAEAMRTVGDGQRARRLLEAVLARAEAGPQRADALHQLALVATDDGGPQLAEAALAEAGTDLALLADIEMSAAMFAVMGGAMPAARQHAESAARHAAAAEQPFLLARALSNVAFLRHVAGDGLQRELLVRSGRLERAGGGHLRDDTALQILGFQLYVNGDLSEAREVLLVELERSRELGYLDHESFGLLLLAELEVRAGRWQLADEYARQTLELSLGTELWNAEAGAQWIVALVDAHLGRVDSARLHAETGRRQAEALGDLTFATRCSHVLGFLELSLGDAPAAVRHLAPLRGSEARLGVREPAMFCIGPDLAEALVLAGDMEDAKAVQVDLETRGRQLERTWAVATGLRCAGLIAAAEGQPGPALASLARAVELHAVLQQPFDRARTLLALGTVQRRAKQRADARGSLEAALAVFEELGAVLWAERARAETARLGGRRARGERDELTATERRIAALAAEGRSNREIAGELFVSERTVEANLTRAYRKLGVRSRTELARRLPAD
jgi:DNA-binding CsgD family transcriptional regulator